MMTPCQLIAVLADSFLVSNFGIFGPGFIMAMSKFFALYILRTDEFL